MHTVCEETLRLQESVICKLEKRLEKGITHTLNYLIPQNCETRRRLLVNHSAVVFVMLTTYYKGSNNTKNKVNCSTSRLSYFTD